PVAAKVRIRVDGAVGFQQRVPNHPFTRNFVPQQLLHARATPISTSRGRDYLFLHDIPLCRICFVILDQFTQQPHRAPSLSYSSLPPPLLSSPHRSCRWPFASSATPRGRRPDSGAPFRHLCLPDGRRRAP